MPNINQRTIESLAKVVETTSKAIFENNTNGQEEAIFRKLFKRAKKLFGILKEVGTVIGAEDIEGGFFWCHHTTFDSIVNQAILFGADETWVETRDDRMSEQLGCDGADLSSLVVSTAKGKMITQDQFEDIMRTVFMAVVHCQLFCKATSTDFAKMM